MNDPSHNPAFITTIGLPWGCAVLVRQLRLPVMKLLYSLSLWTWHASHKHWNGCPAPRVQASMMPSRLEALCTRRRTLHTALKSMLATACDGTRYSMIYHLILPASQPSLRPFCAWNVFLACCEIPTNKNGLDTLHSRKPVAMRRHKATNQMGKCSNQND